MKGRILVVEDDPSVAALACAILECEGYETEQTPSGAAGAAAVARWKPDLVLLDINVDHLSGDGVLRAVRDFSGVPIILSTALPPDDRPARLIALGASAVLPKPWSPQALLLAVDEFIRVVHPIDGPTDVRQLGPADLVRIAGMNPHELDGLPFGAMRLTPDGAIVGINSYEVRGNDLAIESVLQRNFFQDVAPCARVQEFEGVFRDGIRRGELDASLSFVYPMRGGAARVTIRLYYDADHRQAWVFASRRP